MADRVEYYALFEGDEVNGKTYALGDTIADDVDAGTIAFLVGTGRIGSTKPAEADPAGRNFDPTPALPDDSDPQTVQLKVLEGKPLADMTRAELEITARNLVDLSHYDDDVLRVRIAEYREAAARGPDTNSEGPDDADRRPEGDAMAEEDLAILDGTVDDLKRAVAGIDDVERLNRLRASEAAGSKRGTALKAIDDRIAALQPGA